MNVYFITGNVNKYNEVQSFLSQYGFTVSMVDIDLPEIQGTDMEIIKHKAEYALNYMDKPFIVEDSSLEFDALGGLPGPYIKWFLKNVGNSGLVKMLESFENKQGNAVCNIAYFNGESIEYFRGVDKGTIVQEKGTSCFGWDNIFKPDDYETTYGEIELSLKNTTSHRGKALSMLRTALMAVEVRNFNNPNLK